MSFENPQDDPSSDMEKKEEGILNRPKFQENIRLQREQKGGEVDEEKTIEDEG